MSPWLFNLYRDAVRKEVKMGMGMREVIFLEEGREWILSCLHSDDLVLGGESEENLRAMVGWVVEVCRRRGLKVYAGKSKIIVMNAEGGLECEVNVDGISLEHFS